MAKENEPELVPMQRATAASLLAQVVAEVCDLEGMQKNQALIDKVDNLLQSAGPDVHEIIRDSESHQEFVRELRREFEAFTAELKSKLGKGFIIACPEGNQQSVKARPSKTGLHLRDNFRKARQNLKRSSTQDEKIELEEFKHRLLWILTCVAVSADRHI